MPNDEPEGLTALEALGIAIRAEMDSQELFDELARMTDDPQIRRRFELLATEEERHRDYLETRWQELAGGVPMKLRESWLPKGRATREQRAGMRLEDVLDLAIEEGRRAHEFYAEEARGTDDISGRRMFRFLADMKFRQWTTLAQEKEMLMRYPNYGRPGKLPWRPEGSFSRTDKEGN